MTGIALSRRYLVAAGVGTLVGASAFAAASWRERGTAREPTLRRWYAAWEKTDWAPIDALMVDDFTFSSAAGDDHISKSRFKTQCWESQKGLIDRFELEQVSGGGDEALVKYLCRTKNGKSFRNVEYFRFRDERIEALECYFGQLSSFPSAVSAAQKG